MNKIQPELTVLSVYIVIKVHLTILKVIMTLVGTRQTHTIILLHLNIRRCINDT